MRVRKLARYSLRSLLLLMTICCLAMGVWAVYVQPYRLQAQAVVAIQKDQGNVDFVAARGSGWHRWLVTKFLGDERFVEVISVDPGEGHLTRDSLELLPRLKFVQELNLDRTELDDDLLLGISRLEELEKLSIRYTPVTGERIGRLKHLDRLEELNLSGTKVADDDVPKLAELKNLRTLFVRWTGITDEGAIRLQDSLPNCDVYHHALAKVESP